MDKYFNTGGKWDTNKYKAPDALEYTISTNATEEQLKEAYPHLTGMEIDAIIKGKANIAHDLP